MHFICNVPVKDDWSSGRLLEGFRLGGFKSLCICIFILGAMGVNTRLGSLWTRHYDAICKLDNVFNACKLKVPLPRAEYVTKLTAHFEDGENVREREMTRELMNESITLF